MVTTLSKNLTNVRNKTRMGLNDFFLVVEFMRGGGGISPEAHQGLNAEAS